MTQPDETAVAAPRIVLGDEATWKQIGKNDALAEFNFHLKIPSIKLYRQICKNINVLK